MSKLNINIYGNYIGNNFRVESWLSIKSIKSINWLYVNYYVFISVKISSLVRILKKYKFEVLEYIC